jgi:hypothetical protein
MVLYICKKCNKHFNRKQCYDVHINRKFPCIYDEVNDIKTDIKTDNNKIIELEQKNKELEEQNIILQNENKKINELYKNLLEKFVEKNINNISKNNCNNTTNTTNNTTNNNTINFNLVPFGMENLDDLTLEEKTNILNSGFLSSVVCTKKINCNPRLPQYHNISFTNLRSNDAKIYDKDKTWRTIDKEDLFETVILRRLDDVNNILDNDDIQISSYMDSLVKKGTDEDEVVKNTKIKKRFHRTIYDFNKNKQQVKTIKK